jgi:hypothetical protein
MENLEEMMLLDTQEVRDSSSLRPTKAFKLKPRKTLSVFSACA